MEANPEFDGNIIGFIDVDKSTTGGEKHLAFIFIILIFLAYMLHQLISFADRLFQAAVEKLGTKHRI